MERALADSTSLFLESQDQPSNACLESQVAFPTNDYSIETTSDPLTYASSTEPCLDQSTPAKGLSLEDVLQERCTIDDERYAEHTIGWADSERAFLYDKGSGPPTCSAMTIGRGRTAICVAIDRGNVDMVKVLIDHGADIMDIDQTGSTAIHKAFEAGHYEIASLLFSYGPADAASQTDTFGRSALDIAVENNHVELARLALQNGANVNNK